MQNLPTNTKKMIDAKFTAVELDAAITVLEFAAAAFEAMKDAEQRQQNAKMTQQLTTYINFAKVFTERLHEMLEMGDLANKTFH